jgi:hypothetical protein
VRTRDGAFLDIGVHFVSGYQGPVHVVDWTNPEAVRVMDEEYGRLLETGASVIKVDGRGVTIRYEAEESRHTVEVAGHLGEVVLDAPPGVEVRR